MNVADINNEVGNIDLFLLDLILKGEVKNGMKVLDAGCGSGRNLFFFLKQKFDVIGVDRNESEVKASNFLSRSLGRDDVCSQASLSNLPFDSNSFDLIVCSRVLHFAETQDKFHRMILELARVLSPQGFLYLSMDSRIGLEKKVKHKNQSQDGTVLWLTEEELSEMEKTWNHVIDPRTVSFNGQHIETTLILRQIL